MKMTQTLRSLAGWLMTLLMGFALVACGDDPAPLPDDKPEPPLPADQLGLRLTIGEVGLDFAEFTLESKSATEVRWLCAEPAYIPTAPTVLVEGQVAEPGKQLALKAEGLKEATDYVVVAVATDGETQVSDRISFTTLKAEVPPVDPPTLQLTAGVATEYTLTFTVESTGADEVKWVCIEKGSRELTVDQVLKNGSSVEANAAVELTAEALLDDTTYQIYAAARNADHKLLSEPLEMTTLKAAPPVVNYLVQGTQASLIILGTEDPKEVYFAIYDTETNYTFKADLFVAADAPYPPSGEYPLGEMVEGFTSKAYTSFLIEDVDTKARKFTSGSLMLEAIPNETAGTLEYFIEGEFELEGGGLVTVIYEGPIGGITLPKPEPEVVEFEFNASSAMRYDLDASNEVPGEYYLKFYDGDNVVTLDILADPALCDNGNAALPAGTYTLADGTLGSHSGCDYYGPYWSCYFSTCAVVVTVEGEIYHVVMEAEGRDSYASSGKDRIIRMDYTGKISKMFGEE